MKRSTLILTLIIVLAGPNSPAYAQWDLGGTVNPLNSGGVGNYTNLQPNTTNANGSPGQPYLNEPNFIRPSRYQGVYNKSGVVQDTNPLSNIPSQYRHNPYNLSGTLPLTSTRQLSPAMPGVGGALGGLPPTRLDSFVKEAGGAASHIYGDEGTIMWPPMNSFPESDTIEAGIKASTDSRTLTTGHPPSGLPHPSQTFIK
jgi:hypothetical protein